jgi:tetratricopeptide (TPR) repeat protein
MPNENEIFFFIHSMFRIVFIESLPKKTGIYQVQLKLTTDDDQQLRCITDHFEKEIEGAGGWHWIGQLLVQVNQLGRAMEVFKDLLKQALNDMERATYYLHIGSAYESKGNYPEALSNHEKVLANRETALPANHPSSATSYNNIGLVYYKMGEYSKALSFCERSLEIFKLAVGDAHPNTKTLVKSIEIVKKKLWLVDHRLMLLA